MKVLIITASPNKDGLTAACGNAAKASAEQAGAETVLICLNDYEISNCHACGNGWGTCRTEHQCQVQDDFQKLHALFGQADAYVVVTPVYWGEMSERAKAFFDRLRRNEAGKGDQSCACGKYVISVAAAGGSGNGTISCLASMERLFSHIRAQRFDMIGITRLNRNAMIEAIKESTSSMVKLFIGNN
ncbi:MAG TPA: flavodoxin family protein [Clostridiales bacterium]|nr:flavodoxin family protein [Clostridiales bacterium]